MKNANLKDDNANHSCLVGCFAHTSTQSDNRDPDILSYFLVRKTINAQGNESASVSPLYSSSRKRSLDSRSVERSPEPLKLSTESHKARRSEDSKRSRRRKRNSVSSSQSTPSKYQSIKDWSAGVDARTPPSFGSPVCNAIDPPRAAKPGFEWVWFPEGYWAEREIRGFMPPRDSMKLKWWNRSPDQKSRTPTKTMSGDKTASGDKTPPPPSFIIPRIQIGSVSLKSTTKPSRRPSENETQKNNLWDFNFIKSIQREDSHSTQQREGLYYRTKRNIETRFRKRSADKLSVSSLEVPGSLASRTTMLLQGTTSYFDRIQRVGNRRTLATEASPSSSSLTERSRRRFGIAPWHRRHSQDSLLSVSSSVHKLLMGKTPIATPSAEKNYVGPGGKTYPTVQIASLDPHEPTFLPSEAKRINTPPLNPGTPWIQPRGFFFDLNAPDDTGCILSPHTSTDPNGTPKSRPNDCSPLRQWWEADTKHLNTGNKSNHTASKSPPTGLVSPPLFELNLPEHLPSSPLCPKNPKYQGGGTGICVYHGRRRSVGLMHLKRASTEESGAPSTESSKDPLERR